MAVADLLTYTSSDEGLKKVSDIEEEQTTATPEGSLRTPVRPWMWWGEEEEWSDTIFLAWMTSWVLLTEIQKEAPMRVRLFSLGEVGKDKKNSILIILTFESLLGI